MSTLKVHCGKSWQNTEEIEDHLKIKEKVVALAIAKVESISFSFRKFLKFCLKYEFLFSQCLPAL